MYRGMKQACYIVKHLLGHNAYLREVIYKNNVNFVILGHDESKTTVSFIKKILNKYLIVDF